jgi:hypothetical protein
MYNDPWIQNKQIKSNQLYHSHIHNTNIWQQTWSNIEQSIEQKLKQEMEKVYLKQQQKITNMTKTQNKDITITNKNYTRVENQANIQFTHEEIQILNKGLKYNLHYKNKNWIETLALEAETAISNLEITKQNYYRHVVAKKIKDIYRENKNRNKKNNNEYKEQISKE